MRFSTAILVLASAAVAVAQQVVISKGLLVARDESDPNAEGAEIFKHSRNHVVATGSILHRAAQAANYAPKKQDPTKSKASFFEFQFKATAFLGFDERLPPVKEELKLEGGHSDLQEKLREVYNSYDSGLVAKTLVELVPKTNKDPENTKFVLSIVSVNKRNAWNHVEAKLINLDIRLKTDKNGEVEIPAQSAYIYIRELAVNGQYLQDNAERLGKHIEKATTNDFKDFFTTRKESQVEEGWFDFE